MNGAALPSMIGTSGEFSSTIDVVDAEADERGQQVLDRVDADRVARQAGRVVDAADVLDRRRHFEAAEVGAPEADAGIGGSRLEGKRDLVAGVKADSGAGDGSAKCPL